MLPRSLKIYVFVLYNPCSNNFTRCVSNVCVAHNYLQLLLCIHFYAYQMMLSVCCAFRSEHSCFDKRVVWWICCDSDTWHLDKLDQVCPRNPIGFVLDSWSKIQNPGFNTKLPQGSSRDARARVARRVPWEDRYLSMEPYSFFLISGSSLSMEPYRFLLLDSWTNTQHHGFNTTFPNGSFARRAGRVPREDLHGAL